MNVTVCNPLDRTPLSIIIDDSCPVINLTYDWIKQRHAWKERHHPGVPPERYEGDPAKVASVPPTIPAAFAAKWADWCGEQGIRGKFSMVPFPAGVGRIDQGFPHHPAREFAEWMRVTQEMLRPNFDITPEMLTHTYVVDLKTWQLTDDWEQFEWEKPPVALLEDYIAAALTLLRDAGIPCEGVTSPGGFCCRLEAPYAQATLNASLRVNNNPRPFYFLTTHAGPEELPSIPLRNVDKTQGKAIASVIACTGDWFGGWTGYDAGDPNKFLTEDLQGGRLAFTLQNQAPSILLGHWPGFYFGGQEVGFNVLKEVKRRLDAYDPDQTKTLWMKTSEIGQYEMARQLSDLRPEPEKNGTTQIRIETRFPTTNFTLAIDGEAKRVQADGNDLRAVSSRRDFRSGTYLTEGNRTLLAFDLKEGTTTVTVSAA
jgi:hypothetical protein